MKNNLFVIFIAGFFIWNAQFSYQNFENTPQKPRFVESPTVFKSITGPFSPLAADWFWLQSAHIDPSYSNTLKQHKNQSTLYDATALTTHLDPLFYSALRYGTTYLSSIKKEVDLSHQLCDIALYYHKDYFYPYSLKITNEMGYHHPYRYDQIVKWVKKAINETVDVPLWFGDILIHARKNLNQQLLIQSDLKWLLEMARSDKEKAVIKLKIKEYNHY